MRPAQTGAWCVLLLLAAACGGDDKAQNTEPVVGSSGGAGSSSSAPTAGANTARGGSSSSSTSSSTAGTGAGRSNGSAGSGQSAAAGQSGAGGSSKQDDAGSGGAGTTATNTAGTSGTPSTMGTHAADGTDPSFQNPYPGYKSEIYGDDKLWMCKPGLSKNYCIDDIADATEALPDGTFKPWMDDLRTDHPYDCIFWYPTVNRTEDPKSLDFSDPEPMLSSIRGQAARLSRVCNVYAPFYRQVSLNNGGDRELAYKDVVDSFKHYMANWNKGRYFVVYGHSQGTGHAQHLIMDEINNKPEIRERMISTLLIGGGLTTKSFSNIPICTKPDQFNCAVGYRTYGKPTPPKGDAIPADLACVNPAALGGGSTPLHGSFFSSKGSPYAPPLGADFPAHFGLFRELFKGECKPAPSGGGQYLEIDYAGKSDDMRKHFLDLTKEIGFGLHVFDYNFLMDDMVELVRSQAAAMSKAKP